MILFALEGIFFALFCISGYWGQFNLTYFFYGLIGVVWIAILVIRRPLGEKTSLRAVLFYVYFVAIWIVQSVGILIWSLPIVVFTVLSVVGVIFNEQDLASVREKKKQENLPEKQELRPKDQLPLLEKYHQLFKTHHVTDTDLFDSLSTTIQELREGPTFNLVQWYYIVRTIKSLAKPLEKINRKYSEGKITEAQHDALVKKILENKAF